MKIINASDFGIMIHDARKKSKLTQAQLAAASGTGERFIRELEKGKPTCQLDKALLIAAMLGIRIEAFVATPPSMSEVYE